MHDPSAPCAASGCAEPFEAATLQVADGIAEFVHDRPQARHPLGQPLRRDYQRLLDRIESDPSIRALILAGSGGSFSAGGDVREMLARLEDPDRRGEAAQARTRERVRSANAWLERLLHLRVPVIAAVDGPAFGGGFSLVLHADLVLASPRARFCMSFPRIGAVADFGAHFLLPRIVGLGAARELMLTGRSIGAREARRLGLVQAIHAPELLMPRAREAAALFCNGPAEVLAATKRLLHRGAQSDYATLGGLEADAQAAAMAADDHHEAARRFRDKQSLAYDWDRDGRDLGLGLDSDD